MLPITTESRKEEWKTIVTMAEKNGYPRHTINNLKKKLTSRKVQKEKQEQEITQNKKWMTFTYYSPQIRRITNLFKNTNIEIAFRTTNTIQQQLNIGKVNLTNPNGIYRLQCMTCNRVYIGQTGSSISTRYKEHTRYVKYNNPQSAYAMHILNNRHEFEPKTEILKLLKHCTLKNSNRNMLETNECF